MSQGESTSNAVVTTAVLTLPGRYMLATAGVRLPIVDASRSASLFERHWWDLASASSPTYRTRTD